MGDNQGENQNRVWEANELKATLNPDLSFTPKDHKPSVEEDLEQTIIEIEETYKAITKSRHQNQEGMMQ